MADSKTAMPQLARVSDRFGVTRVASPQVDEVYIKTDEEIRTDALQGMMKRPDDAIEGNQSAMSAMAHRGSFQVWADARKQRLNASGTIAMDIAKKLPEKSEMVQSGEARKYKLGVGDTLRDLVRGLKTRYGLAQGEGEIMKALAEANQLRSYAQVGPGTNLDLASTLVKLNQLDLGKQQPAMQPAAGNAANITVPNGTRFQMPARAGF
jgi:hypothetical protein